MERPVATQKTETGLTPGLLKVLNKQIVSNPKNDTRNQAIWRSCSRSGRVCVSPQSSWTLLALGNFFANIYWMHLFALFHCLDDLAFTDFSVCVPIINALRYACEILKEYEGGGAATMPFDLFAGLYTLPGLPGRSDPQDRQFDSKQHEMVLKQGINVYTTKQIDMIQVANFYSGKN
uniref:Uncharacterized protein n=1 Tax=Oncorhynchus mykiss TaxID=8022 RepID=A0A8K9UWF6_ONCMY